jgi:phenylacetate-CoA ligase
MHLFSALKNRYRKLERRKAIQILTTIDPEKLRQHGEKAAVKAFQRTARRVPAYKKLLRERGVDPGKVVDIRSFQELVPILSKEDVFPNTDIQDLCLDGRLDRMKNPLASSGFSGVFSFGINTADNLVSAEKAIDTALDYMFNISERKTFFINCVPMGIKVPTSLPIADTSVRSDIVLALFHKLKRKFDQTIFLSDPHFLKKVLEDGLDSGINWKEENAQFISGEDWFSESFRSYVSDILGTDWESSPTRGLFVSTMGITELELNLFHETLQTVRIRRAAERDPKLRDALFGTGFDVIPLLFHYYPHRIFVETVGDADKPGELVFTILSAANLTPLIRYNSKDEGLIIPLAKVNKVLSETGYPHLCPDLQLPLVALGGRKGKCVATAKASLSPEKARSLLYGNFELARRVTGNFLLSRKDDIIMVEIQLKEGEKNSEHALRAFAELFHSVPGAEVRLFAYHEFRHGMRLDYESKFRHII